MTRTRIHWLEVIFFLIKWVLLMTGTSILVTVAIYFISPFIFNSLGWVELDFFICLAVVWILNLIPVPFVIGLLAVMRFLRRIKDDTY